MLLLFNFKEGKERQEENVSVIHPAY